MRKNLIDERLPALSYEIRNIVKIAKEIEHKGTKIIWENIGDPVDKGEAVPGWIKDIVRNLLNENSTWAYSPSKGLESTRKFLAELVNKRQKIQISEDDLLFFNGLGDAISKIYLLLDKKTRVIGPSPAYPTHSSAEAAHALSEHITYDLDPENNWLPDLEDLRKKVAKNKKIAGILIINPNNPTGTVYSKQILEGIVEIAKEFDLFIICDEIYLNLYYGNFENTPLSDIIGEVCAISLKGISKEIPWPGSRCGWIEAYNVDKDPHFEKYFKALENAKMLEVCSTTLPQAAIPLIFSDNRYPAHLAERNSRFKMHADIAYAFFKDIKGVKVVKPDGAFYMTVLFEKGVLNNSQSLKIENPEVRSYVESITKNVAPDTRFVYYLLGSTGICIVPLSSFYCKRYGFRITLLDTDTEKFKQVLETIRAKIIEYTR